ncbi:MAG: ABC transporter ATP-binding protein [Planctomycetes bacterium]|nr:ABC transporter ATP-binding protein [Planctomycetota bacterium]
MAIDIDVAEITAQKITNDQPISDNVVLSAQHLVKNYGNIQALHDVSLELRKGEVLGFLGPNGAGKSTTMKIISGYVSPSAGIVTINGFDLSKQSLDCRKQIGYLPQQAPLYDDMTVAAYLDHVARLKHVEKNSRRREVVTAIEAANLQEVEKRHIRKLSGGNQRRVGLAQALIGSPPILILDEPTAGLDPAQVANFRDLILRLSEDHSILLSTHVLAEVEACCSRVVVVNRGKGILNESIEELQNRCRQVSQVQIRLLSTDNKDFLAAIENTDWINIIKNDDVLILEAAQEKRGELIQLAQMHGGLRECSEIRRSLEDVFRDLLA